MRVLIIGSGGREHVLAWKLMQSPRVQKVFCAPGNAGIASIAECVDISADNISELVKFARNKEIELTVVGPEAPLVAGIVDAFEAEGLPVFGPDNDAAQLEGSKVFSKHIMQKYNIPTAKSRTFTIADNALAYIREQGAPIVIKADGLAAGKGVVVAQTLPEAEDAVRRIMVEQEFGKAGMRVVVEEFLAGEEVSVMAFTDGNTIVPMVSSQDHKAVYDHDTGPNTGGMGAYSPAPVLTPQLLQQVIREILEPTIAGLKAEGIVFQGVLYAGLMITADGPKVLEYNVRFGDPECQVVLPRLKTDLAAIMLSVINRQLHDQPVNWFDHHTACIVMASGGYPGVYGKGKVIKGLEEAAELQETFIFHAGTVSKGKKTVTSGGRVLGVTAWADDLQSALDKAYAAVRLIEFEGAHYRTDIGHKALQRGS